jgi:gamma-glutamylcyclotransferase (GGCT)/AIG2-like uncharacterized protein YtfP
MRIFAYGTLRDPGYQRALFDRELPLIPARLDGWMTVVAEGGFLTIVPVAGEAVDGDVIVVDDAALRVADAWEEVPLYERIEIDANVAVGAPLRAWVYVRPTAQRERPPAGSLALQSRADILAAIAALRATLE